MKSSVKELVETRLETSLTSNFLLDTNVFIQRRI